MNNKIKKNLGWTVLLLVSFIPAFLWFFIGNGKIQLFTDPVHSLGQIFGLVGMTMFALTFVLSMRLRFIEDVFGGLDKVYAVHGILGGTSLMMILFHPIFLVLNFFPNQINIAMKYLLPSSNWPVNFGLIALLGMILLIFITLFTKIKYNKWKFSHEFLGLVFIFAAIHIFLVRGSVSIDNIFPGYYLYATIVSVIGIGAFVYSLFLRKKKSLVYVIESINEKGDCFDIYMTPKVKPLLYKSGQFIFARFYSRGLPREAHPFSIASKSNSNKLNIAVKKLGDFTKEIGKISVGDEVLIEGPYGRFNSGKGKDQIWIAAGIGITPFIGMAADLENSDSKNKIDLYYISRSRDFIKEEIFSEIPRKNKSFRFIKWESDIKGRISAEDIKKISGKLDDKEFFICGPEKFKEDFISKLVESGIKPEEIHWEEFELR